MTFVVVVADDISEQGIGPLREADGFEIVSTDGDAERLAAELPRADALLVRSATQVTADLLNVAPRLKVIGRAGIGVDNIDVDEATRRGVAVLNAPGANTVSAAEHTFALLLALLRHIPDAVDSMRGGKWDRKAFGGTELRGKTMGLVGLGRIGAHVAGIARAFGMSVLAFDPFLPQSRAKELRVELRSLEELLRAADVISLHAPLTDDTRHMLNAERLAWTKPSAVVVNAARGALIDDHALLEAVESGRLAGAALDVFDPEPLPADSPLRASKRIILTPHLAASTQEAQERVAVEICHSVRQALETGDIGGAVNVPGVSSEVLARARLAMDLARRLGRLAGYLAHGRVDAIRVHFGGPDDGSAKPVTIAAVQGVLESLGVGPVSLVNATVLTDDRNISVTRVVGPPAPGFETSVGVRVGASGRRFAVVGALEPGRVGRVIQIDEFPVDIPAEGHVLILRNSDVPGVIGRVGTLLGAAKVNIGFYHQSRTAPSGGAALAAISVDQTPSKDVLTQLAEVPEIREVRVAHLDGTR